MSNVSNNITPDLAAKFLSTCANWKSAYSVNYFQYIADLYYWLFWPKRLPVKTEPNMCKTFSQTYTALNTELLPPYSKQNSHHLLFVSGKPQNKARSIRRKSGILYHPPQHTLSRVHLKTLYLEVYLVCDFTMCKPSVEYNMIN